MAGGLMTLAAVGAENIIFGTENTIFGTESNTFGTEIIFSVPNKVLCSDRGP